MTVELVSDDVFVSKILQKMFRLGLYNFKIRNVSREELCRRFPAFYFKTVYSGIVGRVIP